MPWNKTEQKDTEETYILIFETSESLSDTEMTEHTITNTDNTLTWFVEYQCAQNLIVQNLYQWLETAQNSEDFISETSALTVPLMFSTQLIKCSWLQLSDCAWFNEKNLSLYSSFEMNLQDKLQIDEHVIENEQKQAVYMNSWLKKNIVKMMFLWVEAHYDVSTYTFMTFLNKWELSLVISHDTKRSCRACSQSSRNRHHWLHFFLNSTVSCSSQMSSQMIDHGRTICK